MDEWFDAWHGVACPLIGMLHAPPLPGAPRFQGRRSDVHAAVLRDVETLVGCGVHGLLLENFGDAPFYPDRVPRSVVAELTALAAAVRRGTDLPLGINVLRNDGRSALAIAHAVGCQFIRVNVLCGARVTDQGLVQGIAHDLLRERAAMPGSVVRILADVDVKHAAPLAVRPLEEEVRELVERGGTDAIVVSGSGTGQPIDLSQLLVVRQAAAGIPVLAGSGVTSANVHRWLPHVDALIVGTSLKVDECAANPVDRSRVAALMERIRETGMAGRP
jgi:membrane complex biogenesis BtpA family protein